MLLIKETDKFVVTYRENDRARRSEIVLQSKSAGKHRAVYSHFDLLNDEGAVIERPPITQEVAKFIFENFERRGDAESFRIYADDLYSGFIKERAAKSLNPADVRHAPTVVENSFTATGQKLSAHWPIFQKFKETGYGSIIRATLTLHQVCSSHCHFCSTISRNRRDSTTLQEAKDFVTSLFDEQAEFNRAQFPTYNELYKQVTGRDIRLRGLILSGGGQPNLWPHFVDFVEWLSTKDIDLGLITNGFPPKIPEEVYSNFKWIRISVTPEDASPFYPGGRFDKQYIPAIIKHNPNITVGYSYVYGPWTSDDILVRIANSIEENGFSYCRTLTDCNLSRSAQLAAHCDLAERLHVLGYTDPRGNPTGKIFHQLKYHGTREEAADLWEVGQCYLQVYNVFWDTTGHEEHGESYCYPCDSVTVLSEEMSSGQISASERKFDAAKWGTVTNRNVSKLYIEPVKPFFDPRMICSACLFMKNNQTVKTLASKTDYDDVQINPNLQHVNFP